ncbi:MAG: Spy/CpxP family protein refolding chaperone [Betaproteobacteria bacterium]
MSKWQFKREWSQVMKRMNLRNTLSAALLAGGTLVGASALADSPQGGYGPGRDMGSGMMGGYGMGQGMMGDYGSGYGMGPGMMGDYGSGYGMGAGMMGGHGARADLHLTVEQRSKIAKIQNDVRRKHWDLMGKMHDEQAQMSEQYDSNQRDDAALSKNFRNMSDLRQQMFDLSLSARRQMDAVLTTEQRDKLRQG